MNLGFSGEILFIMLLALVLFGPRKLPELARQAGRLMAEFRKMSDHLQNQIQTEVGQLELEKADPVKALTPAVEEANSVFQNVSLEGALNRLTEGLMSTPVNGQALETKSKGEQNSPSA